MKTTLLMLVLSVGLLSAVAQPAPGDASATNPPPPASSLALSNAPAPSLTSAALATPEATAASAALAGSIRPPATNYFDGGSNRVSGPVVHAVKSRKPWDLINPFAPMSAGPGTNNVIRTESGRQVGWRLVSCGF